MTDKNKVFVPETDKEFSQRQDARDREAFDRLRMYFRLNFTDGASDGAFLKWCADMVKQSARESLYKVTPADKTCPECKGAKLVRYTFEVAPCETCKGTGKVTP
jgi:hypothetical protein